MKKQLLRIHGGESEANYDNFVDFLNKTEYRPFDKIENKNKWSKTLEKDLGDDFEVFQPVMPNKNCANYNHWKIMFEKTFEFLRDDVILMGHSMGATFLFKYLEENDFPVKIKKILLISGAFDDIKGDLIGNFEFNKSLSNFKKYENITILYHSKDDLVVPFSHFESFKKVLPNAESKIFEDKGHFDKRFDELIEDILSIK